MAEMVAIEDQPLVSVGVPTFNRPELLRRTLDGLISQTYKNLEIIVSDNASTDAQVTNVINEYCTKDERITSYRQVDNYGPFNNFFFVLKKSSGSYFLWAADDDYIEPFFIERCMSLLLSNKLISLATLEAQYVTGEGRRLCFVPEGEAFRKPTNSSGFLRIVHLLNNNYGNLVYGVFRKESLLHGSDVFWEKLSIASSNEIPVLLRVAEHGEIVVQPEIGLYKSVPESVHAQVLWENKGGWLPPTGRISGFRSFVATWGYHRSTLTDIGSALQLISIPVYQKSLLKLVSWWLLVKHFLFMVLCYKPRKVH